MNLGMKGRFVVHKQKVKMSGGVPILDSSGNQILIGTPEKVAEFDNLITDGGLNKFGTDNPIAYFYLSADNTEPTVTDSTIYQFLGGSNTLQAYGSANSNMTSAPYYITKFSTMRFNAGVGTGNISKIATGWGSLSAPIGLWSVALVKDSGGANTVITKLADEVLDVTYQLRSYFSGEDYTGVVAISGVNYNVIVRPSRFKDSWFGGDLLLPSIYVNELRASSGTIAIMTAFPPGSSDAAGVVTHKPYIDMSMQVEKSLSFNLNSANFSTGIRSIEIYNNASIDNCHWQVRFGKVSDDTAIIKTSNDTLTLPPFSLSWGRYVAP